jgi:hypothetical protein
MRAGSRSYGFALPLSGTAFTNPFLLDSERHHLTFAILTFVIIEGYPLVFGRDTFRRSAFDSRPE